MKREPALIAAAVVAALQAIVLLGWVDLTVDQLAAISTTLTAVLALFVRSQVTPTSTLGN